MRVLKPLESDGYTKNEYITLVSQSYTITSGSSTNTEIVTIDFADAPSADWKTSGNLGQYNSASGVYSFPLHSLINYAFYSSQSIVDYGTSSLSATKFNPTSSLYVFNITDDVIGEGIHAGTFSIRVANSSPILDDGYGRLYVGNTNNVVGNVFYKHGLAVVANNIIAPSQSISINGLKLEPNLNVSVKFSSSFSVTEHTIICKLSPTEFGTTIFNPSVGYYKTVTGSYTSGSTTITYKNFVPNISSSASASSGQPLGGLFDSGTLTPYVTSIGLYDTNYNLVAIGRLANPVPRAKNVEQTFIIKFDT